MLGALLGRRAHDFHPLRNKATFGNHVGQTYQLPKHFIHFIIFKFVMHVFVHKTRSNVFSWPPLVTWSLVHFPFKNIYYGNFENLCSSLSSSLFFISTKVGSKNSKKIEKPLKSYFYLLYCLNEVVMRWQWHHLRFDQSSLLHQIKFKNYWMGWHAWSHNLDHVPFYLSCGFKTQSASKRVERAMNLKVHWYVHFQ